MKMSPIHFYLDDRVVQWLKQKAKNGRTKLSDIARNILYDRYDAEAALGMNKGKKK